MAAIPDEVKEFLDRNIESIRQLEILRVLGEDPAREWTATALAHKIQSTPPRTAQEVIALGSRGLVTDFVRGADRHVRYGPVSPDLDATLRLLLRLYEEVPVTMMRWIGSRNDRQPGHLPVVSK